MRIKYILEITRAYQVVLVVKRNKIKQNLPAMWEMHKTRFDS